MINEKKFKIINLVMSIKCTYFLDQRPINNSRIMHTWTEGVKKWVNFWEIVCVTVRVRKKQGQKPGVNYRDKTK